MTPDTCQTCLYCEPEEGFIARMGDCHLHRKFVDLRSTCGGWKPKHNPLV